MSHSLARIYVHLVFSTRHRMPMLDTALRPDLHAYLAAVLKNHGCLVVEINSMDDHVHVLFALARTESVSQIVEHLKSASSKWIKTRGVRHRDFSWQNGYGAFGVCERHIAVVQRYIVEQQQRHHERTYQDEYRTLLDEHHVAYDEHWLWD